MDKQKLIRDLADIVGEESVLTDEKSVREGAKDYIGFRVFQRADGMDDTPQALCVVRPNNVEEVAKVLRFLNTQNTGVTPRTGGSSVTQSIEPVKGGVIIDGSALSGVIDINENNLTVTAGCGTSLEYLEKLLNERGCTTGHFPQSLPLAHLGGLVATRSIGQFSTLYGGIEDLLLGLEAVLPDGEIVRIKNVPRRSCGPDLRHIFIGSEGALAFITEVTLKLFKYRPDERWIRAYSLKSMQAGLDMVRAIITDGYKPAVVRLHDAPEVMMLLKMDEVVPPGEALLMFLCEGPREIAQTTGAAIEKFARQYEATDLGEKPVQAWLSTRNDECHKLDQNNYYNMGLVADTCEVSANWDVIGTIYEAVTQRLPEEFKAMAFVGGHASHCYMQGTNIYFTFAFLEEKGAGTAQENYMRVIALIMEETLKRGGSIAHHHGCGRYRTSWMPEEHGSSYLLLRKLKEALDPNRIMNKGVLLVDQEQ
jgi:alkyldihydroxyacetonephosphate synthase